MDDFCHCGHCEPCEVECARCGKWIWSEDACIVESGDGDWECEPCNIRCDAIDYYKGYGLDFDLDLLDIDLALAGLAQRAILRRLQKG